MIDKELDILDETDAEDESEALDLGRSRWTPPKKRISTIQARRTVEERTDVDEYEDLFDELYDDDD